MDSVTLKVLSFKDKDCRDCLKSICGDWWDMIDKK